MEKKRNDTLDILKLFAAYMVVFIHVPFYGKVGDIVNALARFAVPLFFLVSGYYSYGITPEKIKKRALHIVRLMVVTVVLYTVYGVLEQVLAGNLQGAVSYLRRFVEPKRLVKFFLQNTPFHNSFMWYLFAAAYVYAIFYFATKWKVREKWMLSASVGLLAIHILLGEVLSFVGYAIETSYVRNFLFMGIPFFGLGLFAKKYAEKLRTVPGWVVAACLLAGAAESVLSRLLNGQNELYIGSALILFAFVVMFLKHRDTEYPAALTALTGCSTYIYILHVLMSKCILKLYLPLGVNYESSVDLQMLHPLIVCCVTTALAYAIEKIGTNRSVINSGKNN